MSPSYRSGRSPDISALLGDHCVGIREIPTDAIVGSVDHPVDFDRFFRTRRRELKRRLDALRDAFRDRPTPPISVYEAGGLYFVSDGHHRAARDAAQPLPPHGTRAASVSGPAVKAETPSVSSGRQVGGQVGSCHQWSRGRIVSCRAVQSARS
jgi:hypothetical protein